MLTAIQMVVAFQSIGISASMQADPSPKVFRRSFAAVGSEATSKVEGAQVMSRRVAEEVDKERQALDEGQSVEAVEVQFDSELDNDFDKADAGETKVSDVYQDEVAHEEAGGQEDSVVPDAKESQNKAQALLVDNTHMQTYLVDNSSFQAERSESQIPKIWIKGFARTMSSTTQKLISVGMPQNHVSFFEPCDHDHYKGTSQFSHGACMTDVMACNFSEVSHEWDQFWGVNSCCDLTPHNFQQKCKESEQRLFKTISPDLSESLPLLNADKFLQVVHIERDPRSVYASQRLMAFNGQHDLKRLLHICEQAAINMKIFHPRLHKVQFHDLASDPHHAFKALLEEKLHMDMKEVHKQFIEENFNNPSCKEATFSSCKLDSKRSVHKWKTFLTSEEKEAFNNSPDCQAVVSK